MKDAKAHKRRKGENKHGINVVLKYGHGQKCFRQSDPRILCDVLEKAERSKRIKFKILYKTLYLTFYQSQRTEEEILDNSSDEKHAVQSKSPQNYHAQFRFGEINAGSVKSSVKLVSVENCNGKSQTISHAE